jgi:alkaline phosphatase D
MKRPATTIATGMVALLWACGAPEPQPSPEAAPPAAAAIPDKPEISRIAFGSCAFQWVEQPIFRAVVAAEPDIYLSLGDAIYGDFDGEKTYEVTLKSLRAEWRKLADHPDWQHLVANVPIVDGTWDNHDYGHHSAGAEFPLKEESKEIFLDFFGEAADSERRRRPGLYDAEVHGPEGRRVQIVLLDTRTFKSPPKLAERPEGAGGSLGKYAPNEDPEATLLGEAQWAWLEEQLRRPAEVRLIASSGQIVADEKGMDEWGNYPLERRRLFDLIAETGASGVVLLSGNVHFSEISATDEGPYRLVDFTSGGLTHVNEEYPQAQNRYRIAGPYVDVSFGLVEIDWQAEGAAVVHLAAVDVEGRRVFEHGVPLASLQR